MKNILFSGIAVLALGGTALAADLPAKAPAYKAPALAAVDWTGWYAGGHLGVGWSAFRGTYSDVSDEGPLDFRNGGFLGGAQLGYNWQNGRMVYGVEVDGTWPDLSKSRSINFDENFKTSFLGSARVVSGIAIDNLLLFSSIGVAYEQSRFTVHGSAPDPARRNLDGFGIASGFGLEWAFAPNWSARAEYLYYGFDKKKNLGGFTANSSSTDFIRLDDVQVVRFAINYRPGMTLQKTATAPAMNWSGGYAGVHAGYGDSRVVGVYDEVGDSGSFKIDPRGFAGGGQIGWNWQNRAWVYGVELDGTWGGMDDSRVDREGDREKLKTDALASFRGRVGIAADDKLFYVTAGVGYARSSLTVTGSDTPSPAKQSLSSWGPVLGSGIEWAFAPNWTARFEGLTYLFDHKKSTTGLTNDSDTQDYIRQGTVNVLRVGLNYRY